MTAGPAWNARSPDMYRKCDFAAAVVESTVFMLGTSRMHTAARTVVRSTGRMLTPATKPTIVKSSRSTTSFESRRWISLAWSSSTSHGWKGAARTAWSVEQAKLDESRERAYSRSNY